MPDKEYYHANPKHTAETSENVFQDFQDIVRTMLWNTILAIALKSGIGCTSRQSFSIGHIELLTDVIDGYSMEGEFLKIVGFRSLWPVCDLLEAHALRLGNLDRKGPKLNWDAGG